MANEIKSKVFPGYMKGFSSSLPSSFEQGTGGLVTNALDARSTRIEVLALNDSLTVKDNGIGMDEERGIHAFWRRGDHEHLAPDDEETIGQFGIETSILEEICGEIGFTTTQKGETIFAPAIPFIDGEDFRGFDYQVLEADPEDHGTTLVLRKLKNFGGDFSTLAEQLANYYLWEFLPLLDSVELIVNNVRITPGDINSETVYQFKDETSAGTVTQKYHVFKGRPPLSGILVYVRGRKVGDHTTFMTPDMQRIVTDKTLGIVEAPGLHSHIGYDWSDVKSNSVVHGVKAVLTANVNSMRSDIQQSFRHSRRKESRYRIPKIVAQAQEELDKTFDELDDIRATLPDTERVVIQGKESIRLVEAVDNGALAALTPQGFDFPVDNPFYRLPKGQTSPLLHSMRMGAMDATAIEMTRQLLDGHADGLDEYVLRMGEQTRSTFRGTETLTKLLGYDGNGHPSTFSKGRLYGEPQIREIGGWSSALTNRMQRAGLLNPDAESGLYLGQDLKEMVSNFKGTVFAYDVLRELANERHAGKRNQRTIAGQFVLNIEARLAIHLPQLEYVSEVGEGGHVFVIDKTYINTFKALVEKQWLGGGKKYGNIIPAHLAQKKGSTKDHPAPEGQRKVPLQMLEQVFKGEVALPEAPPQEAEERQEDFKVTDVLPKRMSVPDACAHYNLVPYFLQRLMAVNYIDPAKLDRRHPQKSIFHTSSLEKLATETEGLSYAGQFVREYLADKEGISSVLRSRWILRPDTFLQDEIFTLDYLRNINTPDDPIMMVEDAHIDDFLGVLDAYINTQLDEEISTLGSLGKSGIQSSRTFPIDHIRELSRSLPDQARLAMILYFVQGRPTSEIGNAFQIDPSNVEATLRKSTAQIGYDMNLKKLKQK
ncbi:hypothetical protein GOV09_04060 [Candidatus Woesearchaeota archaeon]|nr:hypothetical protein [Candidatus Woesearchaeota archaeon]